jgi:periplasmic protein CpxP/Spy
MRMISSNSIASVAVAGLLSMPAAGLAQSSPPSATARVTSPPPAAATSPMAGHPVAGKNAQERVENRIKELHTQLRITPAEQPQWDQFAQVMRQNARDMDQAYMQRVQQFATMNAVQNMQSYEEIAEEHVKSLQKLVPAFENLYGAMSEQQKQAADQVFRENSERHAERTSRRGS